MMPHDEMLDNVAAYALGVVPPDEAATILEHLQSCAECQEEYRLLRPAVTAVAYAAETPADVSISPLLKARIMREVRATIVPARQRPRWLPYAAAACLILAIVTGLFNLELKTQLVGMRERVAQQEQTVTDLAAGDARRYPFTGGEAVTRDGRLYLALQHVPKPPAGKVYQAWTLAKGAKAVTPSVTFEPADNGATVVRLPAAPVTLAAVAVSIEPTGGSKQPTSKPIAVVKL